MSYQKDIWTYCEMNQHHIARQVGYHKYLRNQLATNFPGADEDTLRDTLEGLSNLPEMIAAVVRSELEDRALAKGPRGESRKWRSA